MTAEGPAKTFFAYMEAVLASDLTSTQRLVLLVQAKHADAHGGSADRTASRLRRR